MWLGCSASLAGILLADSRHTFGNALTAAKSLGFDGITGRDFALALLTALVIPLIYLCHQVVALTHAVREDPRRYQVHVQLLHPIALFFFIFELAVLESPESGLKKPLIGTRLFLLYFFAAVVLMTWLGYPLSRPQ